MPHPFQRIVAEFIRALLQTGPSSLETPRCGQIWGAITYQRPQVTEDMDILGNDYPAKILETDESPCMSLYQQRKSVVSGTRVSVSVDRGGRRIHKKQIKQQTTKTKTTNE